MIFAADSSILVIFCRRPKPGVGKQRIAASIGTQKAFEFSQLLLNAALEDAATWAGPVVIAPAEIADELWASQLLPRAQVIAQQGDNLGARIQHVDRQIRAAGGQRILFIGSDAPSLNAAQLAQASAALDTADTVLIPARDGGVTLLGAAVPWPTLEDLPWESPELGAALSKCCRDHGLSCTALPQGYDIDTWDDLRFALQSLKQDPRPARQALCKRIEDELSISVIVPVYRDTAALGHLLTKLQTMRSELHEVIVVDGEAAAECASVCAHFGVRYQSSKPGRGLQLQAGAEQAAGNILWFLHADHEPLPTATKFIRNSVASGNAGGFFRFRFLGNRSMLKRLLEWAINIRSKLGTPYGDQGLFAQRAAFFAAGGFPPQPLFEEVPLVRALRKQGRFTMVNSSIGVSPRRWERDGWLVRTARNRMLAVAYAIGVAPQTLARLYTQQRPLS